MKNKIDLYTTYYLEKNTSRNRELINCLRKNLLNECVSSVTVFNEGGDLKSIVSDKLTIVYISKRPNDQDFIKYINKTGTSNAIHIIANTDIYFDDILPF